MLARIIKNQDAAAVRCQPFFVREADGNIFGDHSRKLAREATAEESVSASVGEFVFPSFDSLEAATIGQPENLADKAAGEVVPFTASAEDVLQNAREEAARILAQAEQQIEMMQQAIREKSLQEARRMIEAENAAEVNEMRERLTDAINRISALSEEIAARIETEAVELALEIAKKIVGREVMFDRDIALTLVKVSLKKLHNRRAHAQVRLNPEDCAYVETHRGKIDFHGALEIVADASISPGSCLIHTDTGDVDARIESQFDEISRALIGR